MERENTEAGVREKREEGASEEWKQKKDDAINSSMMNSEFYFCFNTRNNPAAVQQ